MRKEFEFGTLGLALVGREIQHTFPDMSDEDFSVLIRVLSAVKDGDNLSENGDDRTDWSLDDSGLFVECVRSDEDIDVDGIIPASVYWNVYDEEHENSGCNYDKGKWCSGVITLYEYHRTTPREMRAAENKARTEGIKLGVEAARETANI